MLKALKQILLFAFLGLAWLLAGSASAQGPMRYGQAGGLDIPTYGYAAQYYGQPQGCCVPCCAPPPCCVRMAPCASRCGELTLGPGLALDGGVGPYPEGGYGGGGYVVMGGGGYAGGRAGGSSSAQSSAQASAQARASATASSQVNVRIGGGGGKRCGGGCGGH